MMTMLVLSTSCATLFTSDKQLIAVSSAQPGAKVTVNGAPYGATPAQVPVDKTTSQIITITNPDGTQFTCAANATVGIGWVVLDILLGVLPLVVDAITGKWKSLDQTICHSPN